MSDMNAFALGVFVLLSSPVWITFLEGFFGALKLGDFTTKIDAEINWAGQRLGHWIRRTDIDG